MKSIFLLSVLLVLIVAELTLFSYTPSYWNNDKPKIDLSKYRKFTKKTPMPRFVQKSNTNAKVYDTDKLKNFNEQVQLKLNEKRNKFFNNLNDQVGKLLQDKKNKKVNPIPDAPKFSEA